MLIVVRTYQDIIRTKALQCSRRKYYRGKPDTTVLSNGNMMDIVKYSESIVELCLENSDAHACS
jgi:hypothetical protein